VKRQGRPLTFLTVLIAGISMTTAGTTALATAKTGTLQRRTPAYSQDLERHSLAAYTAVPAATSSVPYDIINYNSLFALLPMCLGTKDGQNDQVAWLWQCNSHPDQTWHTGNYSSTDPTYFQIVNGNNMCLGVDNSALNEGADVVGWVCNGHRDQYWTFVDSNCDDYQPIRNLNSGMVVGVSDNGDSNGDAIVQWEWQQQCNNQYWFTP
jgi:hypothetical protein